MILSGERAETRDKIWQEFNQVIILEKSVFLKVLEKACKVIFKGLQISPHEVPFVPLLPLLSCGLVSRQE